MKIFKDSVGRRIHVGCRVRFRGHVYTLARFLPTDGRPGCSEIGFYEPQHTPEVADELAVDLIDGGPDPIEPWVLNLVK